VRRATERLSLFKMFDSHLQLLSVLNTLHD